MRVSKRAWGAAVLLWVGATSTPPSPADADEAGAEFLAPFLLTRDFAQETLALMRERPATDPRAGTGSGDGFARLPLIPDAGRPQAPEGSPASLAPFERHIRDAARRYGVDPNLIRAVILAESRGDHLAVSPKDARGLMQILPRTGRELGVPRAADLFHPRTNIFVGTRYLAQLLSQSNGDVRRALASYLAGPAVPSDGDNVPAEIRAYIPRVLRLWAELRNSRIPPP